jgi:PAT family beta-lactamase induction signal transducer AmpG
MKAIHSWRDALSIYSQPRVVGMIFLGFSAGLPFLLVFSTLSAWLADEGASRTIIGFFGWVGITYSIKFFWAPVVDKLPLPLLTRLLGKRRSWMLLAQLGIAFGLVGLAGLDVQSQIEQIAYFAVWIAFCSATQDIVVDAYRIEAAVPEYQGAMAATYVFGYRLALLVAGAGALYIAEFMSWESAYIAMASCMGIGVLTTLLVSEPEHKLNPDTKEMENQLETAMGIKDSDGGLVRVARWFAEAIISPFADFFKRNGRFGMMILALIAVYKLSDITMGIMANPFYLDLGFSKKEIADVTKIFGFFMTIVGAATGGIMVMRYGIMRPLLLGAILVASTNLLFATLAIVEPNLTILALVISADNLSGGLATSVFIAYLSSLTNSAYTATQYALFSSLMTLPAKIVSGFSGVIVDGFGYYFFFVFAAGIGIPAIILVLLLMKYQARSAKL